MKNVKTAPSLTIKNTKNNFTKIKVLLLRNNAIFQVNRCSESGFIQICGVLIRFYIVNLFTPDRLETSAVIATQILQRNILWPNRRRIEEKEDELTRRIHNVKCY